MPTGEERAFALRLGEHRLGVREARVHCRRCAVDLAPFEFVWSGTEEQLGE